jgi:natural product biosynthesis luciferase-like monooxygenase protein
MESRDLKNVTGRTGPLSYGQRALWFLQQLAPDNCAYNISVAARITGPLDAALLSSCFKSLVERHASLRTVFPANKGKPIQFVRDGIDVQFDMLDGSGVDWKDAKTRLVEECHKPFDLERGPVLRITLLKLSDNESVLLLVVHHIAVDYSSVVQLFRELSLLYAAEGRRSTLPSLTLTYIDYAKWQNEMLAGPEGTRLWEFWKKELSGQLPIINLPVEFPRRQRQTFRGDTCHFEFPAPLSADLRRLVRDTNGSLYTVLLAAVFAMFHLSTGQDDVLIGSTPIGRRGYKYEGIVGFFHNPIVLRSRLHAASTFARLHGQVRRTVENALEHRDYPFSYLVERLKPPRDPAVSPIFQVMFVMYEDAGDAALQASGGRAGRISVGPLEFEFIDIEDAVSMLDMTLTFVDEDQSLSASIQYNTDLFQRSTIERIARDLMVIIEAVAREPDKLVEDLLLTSRNDVARTDEVPDVPCGGDVSPRRSKNSSDRGSGMELGLLFSGRHPGYASGQTGFTLFTEAARFADRNGFGAIWLLSDELLSDESAGQSGTTASSAVMGAAVAVLTDHIEIRGGVSLRFQNPIRIAEEWSVVDNLSHGRGAIVLSIPGPQARRPFLVEGSCDESAVLEGADLLRRLWRGDSINCRGVNGREILVKTLPRPVQPSLPVWVLARDGECARAGAELGLGLLIDFRTTPLRELRTIVQAYREVLVTRGESAVSDLRGHVTAVVPTFISADGEKSAMALSLARTSVARSIIPHLQGSTSGVEHEAALAQGVMAATHSVESELDTEARTLCGTPDQCIERIQALRGLGVDEIACWIDFGLDPELIQSGFAGLKHVVESCRGVEPLDHVTAGHLTLSSEASRDQVVDSLEVDAARDRARTRRGMTRKRQGLVSHGTGSDDEA